MVDLNGKLRLHPEFAFQVEHIGMEQAPVLVIDRFLADAQIIGSAFGLGASRVARELSSFSLVTTRPDDLHLLQRLPHFDNTDDRQLALLHYLCPASHGGTSFYRHRKTGFEAALNRMLVYRSITLHSADIAPTFEGRDDPRSGRLTANTFFFYA